MAVGKTRGAPKIAPPPVELPKCEKATAPPNPEDYGQIVTVNVGSFAEQRTFYVHEGLLTYYSTYFKTALKEVWEEGDTRTVDLATDQPEVFQAFFAWLYTGKLYYALDITGRIPTSFRLICQMFVFGDARGAPDFCNAALDLLYQKQQQQWLFYQTELNFIYDNTIPSSALRKVVVDFGLEMYRFEQIKDQNDRPLDIYPKEFFADLITAIMGLGKRPIPSAAGYPTGAYSQCTYTLYTKDLVCQRYHNHSDATVATTSAWGFPC